MPYVDGFVIPLQKKNLAAYRKMAKWGAKTWMKYGALAYYECVGDDLNPKMPATFPKMLKTKPAETVIFAWIVYKSKAHRNKVNKLVMSDPGMKDFDPKKMPFDFARMLTGGFKVIVQG